MDKVTEAEMAIMMAMVCLAPLVHVTARTFVISGHYAQHHILCRLVCRRCSPLLQWQAHYYPIMMAPLLLWPFYGTPGEQLRCSKSIWKDGCRWVGWASCIIT